MTTPSKNTNTAKLLNETCSCITLDKTLLKQRLEEHIGERELVENIYEARPNLFSGTTVFLSPEDFNSMIKVISSIESVIALPSFQASVLQCSPSLAHADFGTKGAFMGYDFHLQDDGPKLIEINTNAGGGLLNLHLARAQEICCQPSHLFRETHEKLSQLEERFCAMFLNEWQAQKGNEKLGLVVILDEDPEKQYLYPEFLLFQQLFSKHNIAAAIAAPQDLTWKEGKLWLKEKPVSLIYNRLTDFYLSDVKHAAIREAYQTGAVVLTPSPRHHALYANKSNLVMMSQSEELSKLGVNEEIKKTLLQAIPKTEEVNASNAEELWERRKQLFFKPTSGFGSKATYRGDKLTLRVWEEIKKGDYVAQALVSPCQRKVKVDNQDTDLKLDLRAYVYAGEIQLLAARLYAGQTTNFRTTGGGFAPVFVIA